MLLFLFTLFNFVNFHKWLIPNIKDQIYISNAEKSLRRTEAHRMLFILTRTAKSKNPLDERPTGCFGCPCQAQIDDTRINRNALFYRLSRAFFYVILITFSSLYHFRKAVLEGCFTDD